MNVNSISSNMQNNKRQNFGKLIRPKQNSAEAKALADIFQYRPEDEIVRLEKIISNIATEQKKNPINIRFKVNPDNNNKVGIYVGNNAKMRNWANFELRTFTSDVISELMGASLSATKDLERETFKRRILKAWG